MKEIIRLQNVTASHPQYGYISKYNLSINKGELIYLLGLHGSGKRALKELIAARIPLENGSIYINEKLVHGYDQQQATGHGITIIDSERGLFDSLSISENIVLAMSSDINLLSYYNKERLKREAEVILTILEWEADVATPVRELSAFERMALCLAKAIKANSQLIIVDCMVAQLSYTEELKFLEMMKTLKKRGLSFLTINDKCNSFMEQSDKIEIIKKGQDVKTIYADEISRTDITDFIAGNIKEYELSNKQETTMHKKGTIRALLEMEPALHVSVAKYLKKICSEISLFDENINLPGEDELANHKKTLAIIPMESANMLLPNLSIGDNIAMVRYKRLSNGFRIVTKGILRYLEREFCEKCHIENPPEKVIGLTYLERKMLSIHRWAAANIKVVILEEPFVNLDLLNIKLFKIYIRNLQNLGISIVILCSNPDELAEICSEVILLENGKMIKKYTDTEIKDIKDDISVMIKK